jgi:hypothetical protein
MKENQNVGAPTAVVYNDDRTRKGSRTECVERRRFQEAVKAWQGSDLREEVVAFLQKFTLLHQETTERVYRPEVIG